MSLTTFDVDVENVSKLGTHPNSDDGYSPDELKSVFDKGNADIKAFINNTLIPELVEQIAAAARGVAFEGIAGNLIDDGSITSNKLSTEEGAEAVTTNNIRAYAITRDRLSQALQTTLTNLETNLEYALEVLATKATLSALATVATSGKYSDLSGRPSIPTIDASVVEGSTNGLQSRLVQQLVDAKANTNHASTGTGYGVGNNSNYGHLKLLAATNSTLGVGDGTAATPSAVKSAYDLAASKAQTNHASSGTGYGVGNDTNYGHLKLSAAVNGTQGVSGGIAATPSAVKEAYDLAATKQAQHVTRTVTYNSGATSRTITVNGVTANNTVLVAPAPASYAQWVDCRMRVTSQSNNSITITADYAPTANVTINVCILS